MNSISSPAPRTSTKVHDVHERLLEMAGTLGPNAKLPTVQQLRRELGVSLTTLDSVLKQLETQNIIFRKQGSGIYVSPRVHQKCVGLVCQPGFFSAGTSPFWHELIEGVRKWAADSGESFRFYLALGSPDGSVPVNTDLIEDVAAGRTDGVLFVGNNPAAQEWLREHRVPTVVFAGQGEYRVEIDVEQLLELGVRHLVGRGCKRPALLTHWEKKMDPPHTLAQSREVNAFCSLLKAQGLICRPELLWDAAAVEDRVPSVPDTHQEQGYQAVVTLFDGTHEAPDGLLCMDDMMTRGVLAGLRKLGLRPGTDVEVVSHINRGSTILQGEDENIAFVEVSPAEIVSAMFSQLEILMFGDKPSHLCAAVPARFKDGRSTDQ